MLKDKTAFIWMLLAPVVFIVVMSIAYGNDSSQSGSKYPICIVNLDSGSYSVRLIEMIKSDKTFGVLDEDYDSARKLVQNGETSMGIVIPEGFSEAMDNGELKAAGILKLQDNESTMAISMVVYNYIYQLKVSADTGREAASELSKYGKIDNRDIPQIKGKVQSQVLSNLSSPAITCNSVNVSSDIKEGLSGFSYAAIGIVVLFIMFFITNSTGSILEEKDEGTWNRLVSTPTRNFSIMGGFMTSSLIKGWIQIGLLYIISRFVFRTDWGNSIPGLFILFTCFLLAVIGLGLALSSFVKSKAQLSVITPIIVMPTCLIAGCMWPREAMPDFMLSISNFLPQTWVMKGMTDLVARGSDISAIYMPCIILLVFAAVFFTAGLTLLKFKNR